MSIWRQLVECARAVPGFVAGWPSRWMRDAHDACESIDGEPYCTSPLHRRLVRWPCQEYMEAVETLAEHPSWR